jgi:hypothetical protein
MRGTGSWALVLGLMVGFAGGAALLHEHALSLVAEPAPGPAATEIEQPRLRPDAGPADAGEAVHDQEAQARQGSPP